MCCAKKQLVPLQIYEDVVLCALVRTAAAGKLSVD